VTFGKGKSNVPHGLTFNKDDGKGKTRKSTNRRDPDSEGGDPSGDSDSEEQAETPHVHNRKKERSASKGKRKLAPSSSESSSDSDSDSSSPGDNPSESSQPDTSRSSSPSSTSDSDSAKRDKRRRRKSKSKRSKGKRDKRHKRESKAEREERKSLARQKVAPPTEYDGKPDLLVFDKWTYEVNTWVEMSKYRDPTALKILVKYVTGQAGEFFMNFIAGNEDAWTLKAMYEALFDYCFPSDFKDRLRARLTNSVQGKRRIREFIRDIEKLAARFPDVNERAVIQTFWNGMHQSTRLRLIEWEISPEHTPLEKIVRRAVAIERSEETYRREVKANQTGPPERSWGRFANRVDGPKPYRPTGEGSGSGNRNKPDSVRANAVTPQPSTSQPRSFTNRRRGRQISRAKRDELRAAGKCFQCEEPGHDQRNCPKLHSMRRPEVHAARIEQARGERLSSTRGTPDVRVNLVVLGMEGEHTDDTTGPMRRAYGLCAMEWGPDDRWLDVTTRVDSRYAIYEYETGSGDLVEIFDSLQPALETLEVDSHRFSDPNFRISHVHALDANTDLSCIRVGGFDDRHYREYGNRRNYERWEWPALRWLRDLMQEQAQFESSDEKVNVWPAMDGYCLHLDGTDVFYTLKHSESLGDQFNPRRVLNQMRAMKSIKEEDRPTIFHDSALNRRQSIMLHAVKLMVGASRARKRTNQAEGALLVERTAMRLKDQTRMVPEPVVVLAKIGGHQIRALLDTGSMADFLSTTVVDQLNLQKEYYSKPLSVQLAVHGSRSKINCGVRVNFEYQNINCERRFDVANLDNYDAILGTPFLFQHKIAVGINPACVVVGSDKPVELEGPDMVTISSVAADFLNDELDKLRAELRSEAEDLCTDTSRTVLPPLRAVNHTIPLIDEHKVYRFRPLKCPEAFREQWREKKNAYLTTGRWRTATGHNAIPLLMIPKVSSAGEKPGLRMVFDKREQNENTYKLVSLLPNIEEILHEVSKHKHQSLIDGKDAYEQIQVIPEHVPRTLFTTPDGTMESLVMQQGDSNAGATYQTLMNHLFA
jgi:hypothetical protein